MPTPEQIAAMQKYAPVWECIGKKGVTSKYKLNSRLKKPLYQMALRYKQQYDQALVDQQTSADKIEFSTATAPGSRTLERMYKKGDDGYNRDFREMLFCDDGLAKFRNMNIRRIAELNMAELLPETPEEACVMNAQRVADVQLCADAMHLNSSPKSFTIKPEVDEFFEYNATLYEGAMDTKNIYDGLTCNAALVAPDNLGQKDLDAFYAIDPDDRRVKKTMASAENRHEITSALMVRAHFDPKRINAIHSLKQQGVIGPESKYVKCFDTETGERIKFNRAIEQYKDSPASVRFEKMDAAERQKLDAALAEAAVVNPDRPKVNTEPKEFRKTCRQMYDLLDKANRPETNTDPNYTRAMELLREYGNASKLPTQNQVRDLSRTLLTTCRAYTDAKLGLKVRESERLSAKQGKRVDYTFGPQTQKQFDAAGKAAETFGAIMGQLAYESLLAREKQLERDNFKTELEKKTNEKLSRTGKAASAQAKKPANAKVSHAPAARPKPPAADPHRAEKELITAAEKTAQKLAPCYKKAAKAEAKIKAVNDPAFKSGRDLATLTAFSMLAAEDGSLPHDAPHPILDTLNKMGAANFIRGVQNSSVIRQAMSTLSGEPAEMAAKMGNLIKNNKIETQLVPLLSNAKALKNIRDSAAVTKTDTKAAKNTKTQSKTAAKQTGKSKTAGKTAKTQTVGKKPQVPGKFGPG